MMETKDSYVFGERKAIEKDIEQGVGEPAGIFAEAMKEAAQGVRKHRNAPNTGKRAGLRPKVDAVPYTPFLNRQQRRAVARLVAKQTG
jgi:hypothetical protein